MTTEEIKRWRVVWQLGDLVHCIFVRGRDETHAREVALHHIAEPAAVIISLTLDVRDPPWHI